MTIEDPRPTGQDAMDLQLFVNSVVDYAIIGLDTTGMVSSWNTGAERVKGYAAHEIIGNNFSVFYPEQDQRSGLPQSLLAEAESTGHVKHTGWRVRKDGTKFWGDVVISAIHNDAGDLIGFVKITRDLTDKKLAEQREVELRTKLEIANRMKSEFLANMSHEVRTPLNGVMGMLTLLLDTSLDEKQRDLAGTALTSSSALLRIVNDILDFSKIEAGRMELDVAPFVVGEVLNEVRDLFEPQVREKGLRFQVIKEDGVYDPVVGDAGRLRQVLTNLVGNAVKFTGEGSIKLLATIEAKTDQATTAYFEVTDTGIGLNEESQERLFEAFTQADVSTTRRFGGTGLGLSISQQLVSLMGGTIEVVSQPGRGSTFSFTAEFANALHDVTGTVQHRMPAQAEKPVALSGLGRVLVAEDNVTNQQVLEWMLESLGYEVVVVGNGQEAVDAVIAQRFHAVLMDCQMPVLDGFEATTCIRSLEEPVSSVPIVAVTASALNEDRERCVDVGMNDFVAKPISRVELGAVLSRVAVLSE